MQPGFHSTESDDSHSRNLIQRKIFDKVEQEHGPVGQGKLIQESHKLSLLFLKNEQVVRAVFEFRRIVCKLLKNSGFTFPFAPALKAFLVRDAEEPTAKFAIVTKRIDVSHGVDEGFLDDIQAGLFIVHQFESINV